MSENSALSELAKKLEQSKEREIKQVQMIEKEKLNELSEALSEQLKKGLNTIEEDMTTKLYSFEEKLSKARSRIVQEEKEFLKEIQNLKMEFEKEVKTIKQIQSNIKMKQWIIPSIIGISIVVGLAVGTRGLGAYATHQLQVIEENKKTIVELEQLIKGQNKIKNKYITRVWSNAIGVKREPRVWLDRSETGLWIVEFERLEK